MQPTRGIGLNRKWARGQVVSGVDQKVMEDQVSKLSRKKYLINWTERFKFFGFYVKKQLIRDIIDYIDMENEEGIIIFLDQQKTFDRIEWGWLQGCLKN